MGKILEYIEQNNESGFHCYSTKKVSLDDNTHETVSSENSDTDTIPMDTSGKFAETNTQRVNTVQISNSLIINTPPYFKYFLDGSRHTYKVDDIAICNKIFPIVAGQVVVGCCHRPDRNTFKKAELCTKIVLSLPEDFHTKGKPKDFARFYCKKLNEYLKKNNRYIASRNIEVSNIVFYNTDGDDVKEGEKHSLRNSGVAQIQNVMLDEEQLMVERFCKNNLLNDENWLIKDGSLEYNPSYSNLDKSQWNKMRTNYKRVVGISKTFNPSILNNYDNQPLAKIIANLKPFERTKAYIYTSEHSQNQHTTFAVWYLRLRNSNFRETHFSDIVKCEMIMSDEDQLFDSNLIDSLSASIIKEAYPVCFGSDSRWGNHLYPVYLTETFCKSQYINSNIFLSFF